MSSLPLLVYGATGYTGQLLARKAVERGLRPVLSARSGARLEGLATSLGLEHRVASLDQGLEAALSGMQAVLNAAGPFSETSRPLVEACLRAGIHYIDLSGELSTFEALRQHDVEAQRRGMMLMPGAGFDVVPTDCLALHLAGRVKEPRRLALGISGLELISRGSFKTLLSEAATQGIHVRRGGELVRVPPGSLQRAFDFGAGPRLGAALNGAELVTAWLSTGIPDIEVYFETHPLLELSLAARSWFEPFLGSPLARAWVDMLARSLPEGPSEAQRVGRRAVIVAEVEDGMGRRARARLRTPEAYGFSCTTALAIAQRVLAGDLEPGFQTPARVYGPDFVLGFDGVFREDL